ncbi:MAG: hypothetical protein P8O83_03410 [Flavobacteriaceae bacterium]|jgi:hypothetical protein|nr:hypothetical protein [Flavobacteriaceae bacterium]
MIGVIANPKKSLVIEMDMKSIKKAINLIPTLRPKYKATSSDEILNQFTFEATEFLSLGVYMDISVTFIEDNKTEVTVEIRRKVGSFNKSHEVQSANDKIQMIFKLISSGLSMTDEEINQIKTKTEDTKMELTPRQKQNGVINGIIILVTIASFIAMYFYFK